jgi:hypothetical protein
MGKCIDCKIQKECRQSEFLIGCKVFKPKDKQMENKVIFESEEKIQISESQGYRIINIIRNYPDESNKELLQRLKDNDHIRKSAVDEAEEMYAQRLDGNYAYTSDNVMSKMYLAIQELKSEIEVLKNGNKNK